MATMEGADPVELAQLDRLEALAARGPGKHEGALREVFELLSALDTCDGFRREKIGFARNAFAIWFSAQKWQNWGENPDVYRSIIKSHVATLRFAVECLAKPGP